MDNNYHNEELILQLTCLRNQLKELQQNIKKMVPLTKNISEYRTYRANVIAQNVETAQYTLQMIKKGRIVALSSNCMD